MRRDLRCFSGLGLKLLGARAFAGRCHLRRRRNRPQRFVASFSILGGFVEKKRSAGQGRGGERVDVTPLVGAPMGGRARLCGARTGAGTRPEKIARCKKKTSVTQTVLGFWMGWLARCGWLVAASGGKAPIVAGKTQTGATASPRSKDRLDADPPWPGTIGGQCGEKNIKRKKYHCQPIFRDCGWLPPNPADVAEFFAKPNGKTYLAETRRGSTRKGKRDAIRANSGERRKGDLQPHGRVSAISQGRAYGIHPSHCAGPWAFPTEIRRPGARDTSPGIHRQIKGRQKIPAYSWSEKISATPG